LRHLAGVLVFLLAFLIIDSAAQEKPAVGKPDQPSIALPENMGDIVAQRATEIKKQLQREAQSLFRREPLEWDWDTLKYLSNLLVSLPLQVPQFMRRAIEQGRLLGAVGSLILFTFLVALFYSIFGQKRIMRRIVAQVAPMQTRVPETVLPFILSAIRVVVAALFPLLLLGAFELVRAMIAYREAWFLFIGKILIIWAVGALLISLLREVLTRGLFKATVDHGPSVFRLARLVVLYAMFGAAVFQGATVFNIRPDVLALIGFVMSVSIVFVLFLLTLKKRALLSFLPELPYSSYRNFVQYLDRFYYPLILFSLLMGFLWCLGYRNLGQVVLVKTWSSIVAYLVIMTAYHVLRNRLHRWSAQAGYGDEAANKLYRSYRGLLLYATILAVAMVVLNLIGLFDLLRRVMSFPVFNLGDNLITFWTILKAVLILLAFIFASRFLQAYLDYKVYPRVGIDPGLGYALNTSLNYSSIAIGFIFALNAVGLDLRFLLVFAGAAGIGIGLGLQNMAANVISGFTLVFGGLIRKGDWIEVDDTLGIVTDIYLRATRLRTRDNIEYLIPNSQFISGTIINYSLSSPEVRLALPVGVSYLADPRQVEKILLQVAEREPLVIKTQAPVVRFVEYGDSSINFELLVWCDVRTSPRRKIRSELYFALFEEFKKADIEIPFPQRDIHIRSTVQEKKMLE
jgi:small-conductance mechanosensitive channel